jgi:hypothetical protein
MYWNNRVVRSLSSYEHSGVKVEEASFEVCEVFYNNKNEPCGHTSACLLGDTFKEAQMVYKRMAEAFDKPALDAELDFNHEYNDEEDENESAE